MDLQRDGPAFCFVHWLCREQSLLIRTIIQVSLNSITLVIKMIGEATVMGSHSSMLIALISILSKIGSYLCSNLKPTTRDQYQEKGCAQSF
jgi:hypothetical protein